MVSSRPTGMGQVCDWLNHNMRQLLYCNLWNVILGKQQQKFMPFDVADRPSGQQTFLSQDRFIPRQKFFLFHIQDKEARMRTSVLVHCFGPSLVGNCTHL